MKENNLSDRLLNFSMSVIIFLRRVNNSEEFLIIKRQLIKSSTSSGANYEEAQGASSRSDFTNKTRIFLKEMRESNYWLKVIYGILIQGELKPDCEILIHESEELKNILGSICKKTERVK